MDKKEITFKQWLAETGTDTSCIGNVPNLLFGGRKPSEYGVQPKKKKKKKKKKA